MASAPSAWRNRDVLWQDLNRRFIDASAPKLGPHFAVDLSLSRLRRDKAAVVRTSFTTAALTVLRAARETPEQEPEPYDETDLPEKIAEWHHLEQLREQAFDQCSSERKNPSTVLSYSPPPRSTATTHKESAKATTATASAVMDSRSAVSRAVLCAAASIAVEELTVAYDHDSKLDPLDIPQNTPSEKLNMGSVVIQAQTFGQRAIDQALNAARRSTQRLAYQQSLIPRSKFERVRNPFAFQATDTNDESDDQVDLEFAKYNPNPEALTPAWSERCLPRFTQVLQKGSGHAVYCDLQWGDRHGRIANLVQRMAVEQGNFGPHLIVTTQPHVEQFCQEFDSIRVSIRREPSSRSPLRVLQYDGSTSHRRKLRAKHLGASAQLGLAESSYHVLVTSYQNLLADYLDFAQQPFCVVVLDEGFAWLGAAQSDPNSQLAQLWDQAMFGTSDAHIGLATGHDWIFGSSEAQSANEAWIGLTCRHRILTTPSLNLSHKQRSMTLPGLMACILPHFADVINEEWDRSRITHDAPSLEHLKKLLTRSIIVHGPNSHPKASLEQLALSSMDGSLVGEEENEPPIPPRFICDEDFVTEGKISQSRRVALSWFSPWLRYELGMASFQKIVDYMKESTRHGHVCHEILPSSVTTSSGASGAVIGSFAYRLGVRCGRSFGSEQGLRQHVAALHAPPGTWLCRTCGSDCGTSQARTHHERACGQPEAGTEVPGAKEGGAPANFGPPGVVGKKAKGNKKPSEPKDKDADGSFRVPGYRGVWVNAAGKHFVKIRNEPLMHDDSDDIMYFDVVEDAALKHDEILHEQGIAKGAELNYNKKDGSRVIYDDNAAASAAGRGVEMLGGGSGSVVPALSVINIKDLPKDVKPLLRDPRQTSRTGGNSKRHVYAYRGVCRQARKGHDRWQSQISFGGTNHYLGTFDSEWDAAAVYAWAHLILYGEEATRKAQLEGEEAAAAYEREKAAMAAGEALPPPPKLEKKKPPKKRGKKEEGEEGEEGETKKQKKAPKASPSVAKKAKPGQKQKPSSDVVPVPALSRAVSKAYVLAPRKAMEDMTDDILCQIVSARIIAACRNGYHTTDADNAPEIDPELRPCAPINALGTVRHSGGAMLLGLNPTLFSWMVDAFLSTYDYESDEHEARTRAYLADEYDEDAGCNISFRTLIQGSVCFLGRASVAAEQAFERLGLGQPLLGGTIGDIDCNIGGTPNSCSESAAIIQHLPTAASEFQILANNDDDIVTLNGKRISIGMGSFPLFNEDICTVGPRVFVFLLPSRSLT